MTEQEFRELVVYSLGALAKENVPYQVFFTLPGDQNDGILRLQKGYNPDQKICFSTGAIAKGDDHLVQHFLHYTANMEEMSTWLQDVRNADGVIDSLKQLSARVDEGFD